jgi:extradiol dioxygenase family protein
MTTKLNTVFEWCNDIAQTRRFYSDALGLTETHARDEENLGVVVYQAGDTQIVITRSPTPKHVLQDWTKTWGFDEGVLQEPAWVIEVAWDSFPHVVERLRNLGVPVFGEPRQEENIRQIIVRDPMGRTVSVDAYPNEQHG